jgi:hypothetical protein
LYPTRNPFEQGIYAVRLNPETLQCVAFIGIKKESKFLPRATCFFVSCGEGGSDFLHLVTAEHVISRITSLGQDLWLRVNVDGPEGVVEILIPDPASKFYYHPDNATEAADVAILPFTSTQTDDQTGNTYNLAIRSLLLTDDAGGFLPGKEYTDSWIGLVGIIGLFRSHHGANKNIPIVRVGNISAMPDEPVPSKYGGEVKAYLIETRSIGGLSGSPVLVFPEISVVFAQGLARVLAKKRPIRDLPGPPALLGLMRGHFDIKNLNEDVVSDDDEPQRSVHAGIGVVIPVEKIMETIRQPKLVALRKANSIRRTS